MSNAIDGKIGHIGNEIDMTSLKEGGTRWHDDDVGRTTDNLSALLEEKGVSAKLGLLYEEVLFFLMRMSSITRCGCTVRRRSASIQGHKERC